MNKITKGDVPDDHAADFSEFLTEFGFGSVNRALTASLRELVAACHETQRGGSITLKIKCKSDGKMTAIAVDLKSAKPEPALPGEIFFGTADGGLCKEDPRQTRFPSKVLDVDSNVRNLRDDR